MLLFCFRDVIPCICSLAVIIPTIITLTGSSVALLMDSAAILAFRTSNSTAFYAPDSLTNSLGHSFRAKKILVTKCVTEEKIYE